MALIIGRKVGESFRVGPNVEITVIRMRDGACRLAIEAPRTVEVVRTELLKGRRLRRHDVRSETQPAGAPEHSGGDCVHDLPGIDDLG